MEAFVKLPEVTADFIWKQKSIGKNSKEFGEEGEKRTTEQ